jgi:apolipoprotein N-acyltransferase|nr:apolipoprotein N-acyltransferase [Rhodoferax sp.]
MAGPGLRIHVADNHALHIAIVCVAAVVHSMGAAWPFSTVFSHGEPNWLLEIASLTALVIVLQATTSRRRAIRLGWIFATIWLCGTFWWLYISMHTYAGLDPILTAVAIFALAAALGGYYALACGAFWLLRGRAACLASLPFAALWTMAEMARGTWLTGFGWGAVGYSHIDGPLATFIPWLGAYGVGALAAWLAAALVFALRGDVVSRVALLTLVVIGLLSPYLAGSWSAPAGNLSVTLLQGNIPQDEKFQAGSGVPLALNWYAEQLAQSKTELIVAPETAIPLLPADLPPLYWDALQARFSSGAQAAMVGFPMGDMAQGYTNSVLAFAAQRDPVWRYDKHHLVPFGEFIPPLFKWFTRMMNIPLGDFNRGTVGQESFEWKGQRLAPNICYEDLFGEELGVRFLDPELAPTIFVNVSNIGWFGDSVAIDQHLQISRMRAMEFERPMIRATNTGATVVIDHTGRVSHSLPRHTRGVLDATVQGRTGITPYAWWVARFGLWPIWIVAIAIVLVATRTRRMRSD